MSSIGTVLERIRAGAARMGLPIEKYAGSVVDWQQHNRDEALELKQSREAAIPVIYQIYEADPDSDMDPNELCERSGLKSNQGNRSFVRYHWKQARLTHQPSAAAAE